MRLLICAMLFSSTLIAAHHQNLLGLSDQTKALYQGLDRLDLNATQLAIKNGADINFEPKGFPIPQTPLYFASERGFVDGVEILIQNGASFLPPSEQRNLLWGVVSPLIWAVMHQHTAVVAIFIKYKDELGRALMEDLRPSQSVPKECAETLDIYPILDLRAPIFNLSALSMAARNGDLALAKLLVENGATVDSPSHHRSTPIMSAVSHDFRDIVNLLLEASANINARDSDNHSVLWYAQTNEMRELLQQRGAHY